MSLKMEFKRGDEEQKKAHNTNLIAAITLHIKAPRAERHVEAIHGQILWAKHKNEK